LRRGFERRLRNVRPYRAVVINRFHDLFYSDLQGHKTWRESTFLGTTIRKNPLDLWIYQEIIYEVKPELIIETGTLHGGSAYYLARLCDWMDRGSVVTIDVKERPQRPAHPRITYLTGSSTAREIVREVEDRARSADSVLVLLDSDHSEAHVREELRLYSPLVTPGSYLIVEDTNVNGHPVTFDYGPGPMEAVETFLSERSDFEVDRSRERLLMTFNPEGFLRRR